MKTHTPGPWKVVPCPVHHGKHPFHDARWVMTADAEVEMSDYVPNDWHLCKGSAICQMRDTTPSDAHLISSAPDLLASLIELESMVAEMLPKHGPCGWGELALNQAREAIAKAKGNP